jgi:hypothetical protein
MDEKIIAAILGIIGGITGSMFTPWAKWQFEKKNQRYQNRVKFLESARNLAYRTKDNFGPFITTEYYAQIRPYLPKKLIKKWEVSQDFKHGYPELLDVLSELEKKWDIL